MCSLHSKSGSCGPIIVPGCLPSIGKFTPPKLPTFNLPNPVSHWRENGPICRFPFHTQGILISRTTSLALRHFQLLRLTMSTQTQTETIVLQTRGSSTQTREPEPDILQDSEPNQPQTKWLYPKIFSAGVSFFVAGVNDGSLGSLIPYIIRSYDIGTNMVAVLSVQVSRNHHHMNLN